MLITPTSLCAAGMPRPNAPEAYQKVVAERLDEMDETFLAALGAYAQAATQQDPILAGGQRC